MDIEFDFDSGDFRKNINKKLKANVEKTVKSTICHEHNERPKISWKKSSASDDFDFELSCCCDDLKEKTLAKLEN